MPLDVDQIQTILKEATLGLRATIRTPEANRLRRKIIKEIRNRPKGSVVEIPREIQVPESGEEHNSLIGK